MLQLVEDPAGHPGPQKGIAVDRGHPDDLHLWRPDEQREGQEIIDVGADVGIEDDGTSYV
jgi:hypothetical protein